MTDHQEIYREQAEQYELLVSREDYQGNILRALNELVPFAGLTVVEFGAGTGRLTGLLEPVVRRIYACDLSPHMLRTAASRLRKPALAASDHRWMAFRDGVADVALSGWSVCYVVVDHPETWQRELTLALNEMRRVTHPGGMLILLETLGTVFEQPTPPVHLHQYYNALEEQGFQRRWIRTDYRFKDRTEAESSAHFFFGDQMVPKIREEGWDVLLPECTGIWWLKTD
jgi:ubiquinone/menaquinone biosynthesis C-methylase UbiE